jgi:hypothetical protein
MYYLYVKTHNITGLKYFGYTKSKDPYSYMGSGKKWKRHLKKHGYNVSTEIVFLSHDREETKRIAIEYSILWDIVDSKNWANMTIEQLEGGFTHINSSSESRKKSVGSKRLNGWFLPENNPMYGKKHTKESKSAHSKKVRGENNPMYGRKQTEETKLKISEAKKQYWLKKKGEIVNGN